MEWKNTDFLVKKKFWHRVLYDMDFWFVPSDPMCLTSCHVVINKQGDDSASGHSGV